jgi:putative nucleotidyltransferase with HDIG domain
MHEIRHCRNSRYGKPNQQKNRYAWGTSNLIFLSSPVAKCDLASLEAFSTTSTPPLSPYQCYSVTAMFKTKAQAGPSPAEIIQTKLNSEQEILPFPQVVGRLVTALKDPLIDSNGLSKIIEEDAALTLRLLRMANSPMFGISNVIESVNHAVTLLGKRPLKNVALTFAASSMFSKDSTCQAQKSALWSHSRGCATVARSLASHVDSLDPDDAFLAGIFHDIGKLLFFDAAPDTYSDFADKFHGEALIPKEREIFDMSHEEVGGQLIKSWQLSEKLMIAVGFHHQPEGAIAHGDLAKVIGCADALARQFGVGSAADPTVEDCSKSLLELGIGFESVAEVVEESLSSFEDN